MGVEGWGMGRLSMMSTDLEPLKPVNLDVWARFYLGWINPTYVGTFSGPYEEHEELCSELTQNLDAINYEPDALIVANEEYMDSREFFIISNRYTDLCEDNPDPYNLDNSMDIAYCDPDYNMDGMGVAIYHIDEEYIEDNLVNNSIMYDPDGNYYDDQEGHPGIVFEEQIAYYGSSLSLGGSSFHSYTHVDYDENPEHQFILNIFDKDLRPVYNPVSDFSYHATSNSYLGYENTRISTNVIDPRQYNMHLKVHWQKCYPEDYPNCSQINLGQYCSMEE
jgi:hypothetical protein